MDRYCLLIDDPHDVKQVERFLSEARNLRVDVRIPTDPAEGEPEIMFCDQGQSVSYFIRAKLEVGDVATGADGMRWP